jgi:hypothetical protein
MPKQSLPMMKPVRFDEEILQNVKIKTDPAFREITGGLVDRISEILRDPTGLGISCCFEGCCVSWCCIQIV